MSPSRLDGLLGYRLRRAQLRAFAAFGEHLAGTGLTLMLYGVLATIDAQPGIGQGKAADALGADRSTMVRLVDELERRGLIRRDAHPGDRRTIVLALTEAGRMLLEQATPMVEASEKSFARALAPAERAQLAALLSRIVSPG